VVGKTTIIIQSLLDKAKADYLPNEILYVPMDYIYTENLTAYEIVKEFKKQGVKYFSFDLSRRALTVELGGRNKGGGNKL
jgi:hypothetical protein